jgi:bifunctional DNA-binding transcriptional regulator/antitoxin component of YhaV-PrlF toxin-antitoxin module
MNSRKDSRQLVRIKSKYQLTLPRKVRRQAGLRVGDLLDAKVEGHKISLTPMSVVEREVLLAFEDVQQGRVKGPFKTAEEAIRSLRRTRR